MYNCFLCVAQSGGVGGHGAGGVGTGVGQVGVPPGPSPAPPGPPHELGTQPLPPGSTPQIQQGSGELQKTVASLVWHSDHSETVMLINQIIGSCSRTLLDAVDWGNT